MALHYDTEVADILIDDGFCEGVRLAGGETVPAKKVITTAGGFEANLDWLAEGWGEAAKNFLVRGTPWNTGTVLKSLLDQGVKPVGALDQCHAVAIDARAPKYVGGSASRATLMSGVAVRSSRMACWSTSSTPWTSSSCCCLALSPCNLASCKK